MSVSSDINFLDFADASFYQKLDALVAWAAVADQAFEQSVQAVLDNVVERGDSALLEYTRQWDGFETDHFIDLEVTPEQRRAALENLDPSLRKALEDSHQRIADFHQRQAAESWEYTDDHGVTIGQRVTPLDKVGVYVPGGKAAYPSSVLMNTVPAKVAGVETIIMVSPCPQGELNSTVLAAAEIAGVDKFFAIGGAQAVAALAYGTESVPRVDKIVGPGNRYVACAKKKVFGQVGLDMVAGPSEILIVCDGQTDPDWIAMDMFSQAEHDEDAQAILISTSVDYIEQVKASIDKLLPTMERSNIIESSLTQRGAFIAVEDLDQAVEVINRIAPEHLELSVESPREMLADIRHAGAIFMGRHTPEAFGDYCAGPNHVLPTSTTARFASPLGVYDFQKRSSIIDCSPEAAHLLADVAATVAKAESLTAHQRSALYRGAKK